MQVVYERTAYFGIAQMSVEPQEFVHLTLADGAFDPFYDEARYVSVMARQFLLQHCGYIYLQRSVLGHADMLIGMCKFNYCAFFLQIGFTARGFLYFCEIIVIRNLMVKGISGWSASLGATLKSLVKMAVQSRRTTVGKRDVAMADSLIILGNGPSLRDTISDYPDLLVRYPLLAVNFAANTPEFLSLKPRYYVLVDPAFFKENPDDNVKTLWWNLGSVVTWRMTLFLPAAEASRVPEEVRRRVDIRKFNPVGVGGFRWFRHKMYDWGLGMPRPRNVLIPSIMLGMQLGYRRIFITGADHSWSRTLEVNDRNEVVSIQPHFYTDDRKELDRVAAIYRNVRLHEIMYSFHVAFKSYFDIEKYARGRGVEIYNATPGSFIDAFARRQLRDI